VTSGITGTFYQATATGFPIVTAEPRGMGAEIRRAIDWRPRGFHPTGPAPEPGGVQGGGAMKLGKASRAGMLAVFGLSPLGQTYAQVPVPPPPGPSALAVPAVAAAPAVPVAPQPTLWGFLGITKAGCAAHKEKICQSQLGLMINGI